MDKGISAVTPPPEEMLRESIDRKRAVRDLTLRGAKLGGQRLNGLRAVNLDLVEADLRKSSLVKINWTGCFLHDALLQDADCVGAVFRLCEFEGARLTRVKLLQARLENSTARGASFDDADLSGAVLTESDFSRASFLYANLERVSASGACFRGADMRGASLRNAELCDCDFRGADLTDADLNGADLTGTDLRGVIGEHPELRADRGPWKGLPPEVRSLAETMAPIVGEVLRSAGERGVIDNDTAQRLVAEAAAYQGGSRRHAPSAETLSAVTRVLDGMGGNGLAALFGALQQPDGGEPPAAVKQMILRLREELGMDETASVEDVLARLLNRSRL